MIPKRSRLNRHWTVGPVALIDVSTPKFPRAIAAVDAADLAAVVDSRGRWGAIRPSRYIVYAARRDKDTGSVVLMHRMLLSPESTLDVDHDNTDGLDNRRINLRTATRSQNCANRISRRGASQFKGVFKSKGRWAAMIKVDGKNYPLGTFDDEALAAGAYDSAAIKFFGEFARPNDPRAAAGKTAVEAIARGAIPHVRISY